MRRFLCLLIGCLIVSLVPSATWAKASMVNAFRPVRNVEAVITNVDMSDGPGDADVNIVLRPLGLNEKSAFPKFVDKQNAVDVFWRPGANALLKRLQDDLALIHLEQAKKLKTGNAPELESLKMLSPSDFSQECRDCAGIGPDGAGCKPLEDAYASHPCPKFAACSACVYDVGRLTGTGLNHHLFKAEVFVNDKGSNSNDMNQTLMTAAQGLGVIPGGTYSFSEAYGKNYNAGGMYNEQAVCREFSWVNGAWQKQPGDICGQHVLVSGVAVEDEEHDDKLEIHPVTSILVAKGNKDYALGTFVDGSYDDYVHYTFDYRSYFSDYGYFSRAWRAYGANCPPGFLLGLEAAYSKCLGKFKEYKKWYPKWATFEFAELQGSAPTTPKGVAWESDCAVTPYETTPQLFPLNAKVGATFPGGPDMKGRKLCDKTTFEMNNSHVEGAAWIGSVRAGWKSGDVSFKITSAKLDSPYGLLAAKDKYGRPDLPAGAADIKAAKSCAAPANAKGTKDLWRWYRWTLKTSGSFTNMGKVEWSWTPSSKNMAVVKNLMSAGGNQEVGLWMAVRGEAPPLAYQGGASVKLFASTPDDLKKFGNGALAEETVSVDAPAPQVHIKASPATLKQVGKTITYETTVTATPLGYCGDSDKLVYKWNRIRNGKPVLAPQGKGPHKITLGIGDRETLELVATDAWGVQSAHDARVFEAPALTVAILSECAKGQTEELAQGNPPGGWSSASTFDKQPSEQRCNEVVLSADLSLSAGIGTTFPKESLDLAIDWTVEYATAPTWTNWVDAKAWRDPKKTKNKYDNDQYVIVPKPAQTFAYRATVKVQDKISGRSDSDFKGKVTNTLSSPTQLVAYLKTLWLWARPGQPFPLADPCGLRCMGNAPIAADWLPSAISIALHNAEAAPPSARWKFENTAFRTMDVAGYAIKAVAKERGVPFTAATRSFGRSKKATSGPIGKEAATFVQQQARTESLGRLRNNPAFFPSQVGLGSKPTPAGMKLPVPK